MSNKVTTHLYNNGDFCGVMVTPSNNLMSSQSIAVAKEDYEAVVEDYSNRKGVTWEMSLTLFKMEMSSNTGVVEVDADEFIAMMNQEEHPIKRVGNQACPIRVAEVKREHLQPYLTQCICLDTGEPQGWE